jgi:putative sterol carrier protein
MAKFPTPEWVNILMDKLNGDEQYANIARNWEGDLLCRIDPSGSLDEEVTYYLDLWHGKCRDAYVVEKEQEVDAVLILDGPYDNYLRLLKGELDPMQALLTRKLGVKGSMTLLVRNVPTVLDFVRCCREVTDSYI